MKVGLNATCLNLRPSGAKNRFSGIYSELFKQLPNVEFTVYEPEDCQTSDWLGSYVNVHYIKTSIESTSRWDKYIQSKYYWTDILGSMKFDIFERFNVPIVKAESAVNLMSIYDIRWMYDNNYIKRNFYKK